MSKFFDSLQESYEEIKARSSPFPPKPQHSSSSTPSGSSALSNSEVPVGNTSGYTREDVRETQLLLPILLKSLVKMDPRFFFVIYLVKYYGVYGLMKNLKANQKRAHNQVLQKIIASAGDEDIITSASKLTLKDPVVFMRIKTLIRSSRCKHLQCFDAEMFYTTMEQTLW
ncbi:SUMO ligase siz1 [Puccinia graminis f. sp. tritici]|uniref:SUMO ligase siz1 n=1 Tax=Puccinia graminis f. sp. tritici TaxID=56615 RepID=A0A5B0Q5R5_PUCGR|nr:SUMO ligase siz1 [Puccinia graminis f. sp. tritici]